MSIVGLALGSAWLAGAAALPGTAQQRERLVPIPANLNYYEPVREKVTPEKLSVDLCVYGGTSAGISAAVQAARDGRTVVLVAPEEHLGGLTTGGLTYTDFGNKGSIGGLSREFYQRLGKKYGVPEEWKFEPSVAEQVYQEMIAEAKVPVRFRHFLKSVSRKGPRLLALTTERGLTVSAKAFIDATYEGDLMAKAKVSYTVGREPNSQYGEKINGVQLHEKHQFEFPTDPYVKEGDPKSGLLRGISPEPLAPQGSGDKKVQAYNFRLTLTKNAVNRIPYPKPVGYDPRDYELLARYLKLDTKFLFGKYDLLRNEKYDKNNHGAFSTDFIGESWAWPEADYKTREKIFRKHVVYQQGLMWFITNDPRVPEDVRARLAEWGLCKDEFVDTGGWSRQLYVREARRMVSDYVVTEQDCRGNRKAEDSVGLGSYGMDSHNCQRVVVNGVVKNEGDVQQAGFPPYQVAYRSLVPKRDECENLLVPVCLSCSHIAYGSVRMEPVFMILAQSAAVAAGLAIDGDGIVQNVSYPALQKRLLQLNQVLEWKGGSGAIAPIDPKGLPGIVLDDQDGKRSGEWSLSSRSGERKVGTGYLHDGNVSKGQASIRFTPELPADNEYEILIIAPANPNRATNVPVTIAIEGGETRTIKLNQRGGEDDDAFRSLGRFRLPAGRKTTVTISNQGTDGFVVIDGVQFLAR
jgi:hypothetical protein